MVETANRPNITGEIKSAVAKKYVVNAAATSSVRMRSPNLGGLAGAAAVAYVCVRV
jgi:hypothetical protein